ncbi:MAG: hypothetical protein ABSH44_11665 [Bryobacteraceae bacterium]
MRAASASPAPVPPPQPTAGAVPLQRKTSPLVWVLVIVLGLFVLGGIVTAGFTWFVVHKVRQAGFDPELMRRNPGLAVSKMIAAANPDAEVLSTDEGRGTITIRDKKTGKVVTMTFDQAKNGKFSFTAQGDDGKTASLEIGAGADKLPSWVPAYPGAKVEGTFAIKGDSGEANGGTFTFSTPDAPAKVMSFYQDKCKELGIKVKMVTNINDGGMIVAADDDEARTLNVLIGTGRGETTAQVTYKLKK